MSATSILGTGKSSREAYLWDARIDGHRLCCRLGVTNGEKIIKAKAVERLKGDSETTEQRKAVTVCTEFQSPLCHLCANFTAF